MIKICMRMTSQAPKARAGEGSNAIDLSAMFDDFGSDLESADESSSDNEDGNLAFDMHESGAGVHESRCDGSASVLKRSPWSTRVMVY